MRDRSLHMNPNYPHFAYPKTNSIFGGTEYGWRATCPCGWECISTGFDREQAQQAANAHNDWYREATRAS